MPGTDTAPGSILPAYALGRGNHRRSTNRRRDFGYDIPPLSIAVRTRNALRGTGAQAMLLGVRYAMSGTDVGNALVRRRNSR
eukprot:730503-Rhodomonas_salina.1